MYEFYSLYVTKASSRFTHTMLMIKQISIRKNSWKNFLVLVKRVFLVFIFKDD